MAAQPMESVQQSVFTDEIDFNVASEDAYVASAETACCACRQALQVVCIYCETGVDTETGQYLTHLTLSNVWAMDRALASQLAPWPGYRRAGNPPNDEDCFANHCPACGAIQDDYFLHSEPGDVFFGLSMGRPETDQIVFTPLAGRIRLSGDYGFETVAE